MVCTALTNRINIYLSRIHLMRLYRVWYLARHVIAVYCHGIDINEWFFTECPYIEDVRSIFLEHSTDKRFVHTKTRFFSLQTLPLTKTYFLHFSLFLHFFFSSVSIFSYQMYTCTLVFFHYSRISINYYIYFLLTVQTRGKLYTPIRINKLNHRERVN